jgi:dolichyl-phosphate-mannose--protein O-mannosyl transferase
VQFHPAQSRPINWPLLTGISVGFWGGANGASISCGGNALVYYLVMAGLVLTSVGFWRPRWDMAIRYVLGWCFCYFPFFLIPRSMYLYHYLVPLILGCLSVGATLDLYCSRYWVGFCGFFVCLLGFAGFVLWSPMSYGSSPYDKRLTIWSDNWVSGDAYHKQLSKRH